MQSYFRSPQIDLLEELRVAHQKLWFVLQFLVALFALWLITPTVYVVNRGGQSWENLFQNHVARDLLFLSIGAVCVLAMAVLVLLDRYWHNSWVKKWRERYRAECKCIVANQPYRDALNSPSDEVDHQIAGFEKFLSRRRLLVPASMRFRRPGEGEKN